MSKVIDINTHAHKEVPAERAVADLQRAVMDVAKQGLAELMDVTEDQKDGTRFNIIQLLDAERCKLWMLIEDLRYHMGKRTK